MRGAPQLRQVTFLSPSLLAYAAMQMLASGHQAPALEVSPRCSAQSLHISRLNGKHCCSVSAQRRLQRQHRLAQKAQYHRSVACLASATSPQNVDLDAKVAVVLGTQWGDEGKGKLVDILAQQYEIVARAQVGNPLMPHVCSFHLLMGMPTMLFMILYIIVYGLQNTAECATVTMLLRREAQTQATQYTMTRAQNMHCILCHLAS